jgi:hypothetical protein
MAGAALRYGVPDATNRLVEMVLDLTEGKRP